MKIVVGCPTTNRTWILPLWKEYLEKNLSDYIDLEYVFVTGLDDSKTLSMLESWDDTTVLTLKEDDIGDVRSWADKTRYEHMALIRNLLLGKVREIEPDYFLSIDSDILLAPGALNSLLEKIDLLDADAIGGLAYLDPIDPNITNAGFWIDWNRCKGFRRAKVGAFYKVDILMALKLMKPSAYSVDYSFHPLGEDLGWSKECKSLTFGFDGTLPSKHVMSQEWLEREDKRIGW